MQRSYSKACKINSIAMGSALKMLINVALWAVEWSKIHYVLALPLSSVLEILYFNVTGPVYLDELCQICLFKFLLNSLFREHFHILLGRLNALQKPLIFSGQSCYLWALLNPCFSLANPSVSTFHLCLSCNFQLIIIPDLNFLGCPLPRSEFDWDVRTEKVQISLKTQTVIF